MRTFSRGHHGELQVGSEMDAGTSGERMVLGNSCRQWSRRVAGTGERRKRSIPSADLKGSCYLWNIAVILRTFE